jgi:hypothetical protein
MANHYRPTHAEANNLFITSEEDRPFVDLSVVRETHLLPIRARRHNTGLTRWGNLVMGLAIDNAMHKGVEPRRTAEAIRAGRATLWAVMNVPEGDLAPGDSPIQFDGSVNFTGDTVTVCGGNGADTTYARFRKADGLYVPDGAWHSRDGEENPVEEEPITETHFGAGLPPELEAGYELGDMEEVVTGAITDDVFIVQGGVDLRE